LARSCCQLSRLRQHSDNFSSPLQVRRSLYTYVERTAIDRDFWISQWRSYERYPISTRLHLPLLSRLSSLRDWLLTRCKPDLQIRRRRRRSFSFEGCHFARNSIRFHQGECLAQQFVVEIDLLEGDGRKLEEARQATQSCFGETSSSRLGRNLRKPKHYSVSRRRFMYCLILALIVVIR